MCSGGGGGGGGPPEPRGMTSSRSPMCMFQPKLRLLGGGLTSPSEGCRELSTQAKHNLTAIRNLEKILRPGVRLPAGAVTPGVTRRTSWFLVKLPGSGLTGPTRILTSPVAAQRRSSDLLNSLKNSQNYSYSLLFLPCSP